jgi:2,4-dienoyl-CoA reductase-like NADH-dependent reductase (Old Yellow Enzyme family)
MGSALFTPLELRSLPLQHRGWVSPMCQYSCEPETGEGVPTDWHLILTEAAAVNAAGRISPRDAGLYNDHQAAAWERITAFVHRHGAAEAKIGTQLAHAGRKASSYWPFSGRKGTVAADDGGWPTVGPGYSSTVSSVPWSLTVIICQC